MHVHYLTKFKFLEEYFLVNWTSGGYFYDISAMLIIAGILITVNLLPVFGRYFKWGIVPLYYICTLYLAALFVNKSTKTHQLWDMPVVIFYIVLLALSSGMMANVLFGSKGLKLPPAYITSFVVYTANMCVMIYAYKQFKPLFYWHIFAVLGLSGLIWIFNTGLEVMITKRNDFYREDDWGIGFVHC